MTSEMNEFDFSDITVAVGAVLGDSVRERKLVRLGNPLKYADGEPDPIRATFPGEAEMPGQIWVHEETENLEPTPPYTVLNTGRGKIRDEDLLYRTPIYLVLDGGGYVTDGIGGRAAEEYLHTVNVRPQRNIDLSQLSYGLLRPSDPVSMRLMFAGAYPVLSTTVYQLLPQLTDDLSSYIPGAGLARAVMVEINPITAAFAYTSGSTFAYDPALDTPAHRETFALYPQAVDTGRFLLGWARLYAGMTQIVQRDILAAQEILNKGAAGNEGDPVTYCGSAVWYAGYQIFYEP